MGTKNHPGDFDCYANAHPNEPMFVLLGRDPQAPALIRNWARVREQLGENPEKINEALACAEACEVWRATLHQSLADTLPAPQTPRRHRDTVLDVLLDIGDDYYFKKYKEKLDD